MHSAFNHGLLRNISGGFGLTAKARLYRFTGHTHHDGEIPVKLVAACNLHEAITYLRKWHPDLDVLRVEFVAMIEIVSGSPLN